MTQKTIAEVLVDTLIAAGVKRIYGVVGDSLNAFLEALAHRRGKIDWIHVRHEEVAAFAAGAQAHLTGELAVCAGSCGPGNVHLVNGLYDCHRSRVPVLAIAAHIPSSEIGSSYFQETHAEHFFRGCSHYSELISQASQMPRVLEIAIQTSLAKKGVSVVAIPGDVAMRKIPYRKPSASVKRVEPVLRPSDTEIGSFAEMLNRARTVTILAGAGCAGAHAELMQVAGALKAPIVTTLRGREHVQYASPYDVGLTGLIGYSSGYHAMMACDTLLILGADFPYTQFYPEKATVVQVDSRGENVGRRTRVDLGLIGDVKATLTEAMGRIKPKTDGAHLKKFTDHYAKVREGLNELAVGTPGLGGKLLYETSIAEIQFWHATGALDGQRLFVDRPDGMISILDPGAAQNRLVDLCRHDTSIESQDAHAHPITTPNGRSVIFTSNRTCHCQVYEVPLPANFK
ncbi:MAG TPA: thiamine pyrophosphate-binding protein [Candidatus Methylacidiphilales bacterium]|jgi:pyruvate dehydrogenase (quinone)|nr:thiamine pyrophosphate-binding protein [Candidatus Methylacidiphilales bacterium]